MKKRILSLLLGLCMIASTAVLFSSCGKKAIDFSKGYTVIYGKDMSSAAAKEVKSFVDLLKGKIDGSLESKRVAFDQELADEADYEILVGNTNRPETEKVLEEINGHGYAISIVGKKLVIVGTTNFLTSQALDYFVDTYLSVDGKISSLKVEKNVVSDMQMLEITNQSGFVYSAYLNEADKVVKQIKDMKAGIGNYSDVRGNGMFMRSESESESENAGNAVEILVGMVDRAEVKDFSSVMDVADYGVSAKNGKIVAFAYNDTMMLKALDLLSDILKDSVYVEGEAKKLFVPADFSRIYSNVDSSFITTDFPKPQGLTLSGTIDADSGLTEYYYHGDSVTEDAYQAYCNDLTGAGYVLYTDHSAESSIFRTYVNEQKGMMLYVAYNAFAHASAGAKKTIRVIVGPTERAGLLPEEMLTLQRFENVAASSITAIQANYVETGKGQIYVVTLADGSFIMIDGGASDTTIQSRIYNVLKDLYTKNHGYAPNGQKPIRIAAWYITHGHGDHVGVISRFINQYSTNGSVRIDTVIANFASDEGYYGAYIDKEANTTFRDHMAEYSAKVTNSKGEKGFDYIKVHTGQKFWLANIECEVLYTHEDLLPNRLHTYNDSSTVIRMTIHQTTDGSIVAGSESTSFIWLGDAQEATCDYLRNMYGSYLKSDMVQAAHHIGTGSDVPLYRLIEPDSVWFPTDYDSFKGSITRSSTMIYKICNQVPSLKYVILSDVCNYTVSVTETGANYDPYSVSNPKGVYAAGEANTVLVSVVGLTSTVRSGFRKK
ncbi:MAG: MBL fold metallo-hydrolase [Ruminococcaceae bacterium]|nr:MBL fold metallo-hydrolase [Oscillospiraceae bacterium]